MLTWAEDNESRGSLKLWRAGTSSTSTEMLEMVRRRLFPAVLYYNILPEYLPRQARDKHLTKQGHVSTGSAKNATFCAIYILKNEHFAKTGSGQTWGKALKKDWLRFVQVLWSVPLVVITLNMMIGYVVTVFIRRPIKGLLMPRVKLALAGARNVFFLRAIFYCNPSIWPRQARDKYTTVGKVENEADVSAGVVGVQLAATTGEKNVLFEPFLYKNDLFTKTGSGQTWEKLKKVHFSYLGRDFLFHSRASAADVCIPIRKRRTDMAWHDMIQYMIYI